MRTTELRLPTETAGRSLPLAVRMPSLIAMLVSVVRVFRNRIEINRLQDLDDNQLRDIGLSRGELKRATHGSSFFEDPSSYLTQSARLRARSLGHDEFYR